MSERVLVLGTGAMATAIAGHLAPLAPVTLAGTWTAALEAMARDGITVHAGEQPLRVRVSAVPLAQAPAAEVVLVLGKSHQTATLAPVAGRAAGPEGLVLSLQNGLGHQQALAEAAPGRVALGVTTMGATLTAPGVVRVHPGLTVLAASGPLAGLVGRTARLLDDAGLTSRVVEDLAPLQWRKLAVNCAINPLSALLRVPNGTLLASETTRTRLEAAAAEVAALARAQGILVDDPVAAAVEVATRTAGNRSSMLQDVERGARTEIDALCGFVVREGRRLGVPTPVNEALWRAVIALGNPGGA